MVAFIIGSDSFEHFKYSQGDVLFVKMKTIMVNATSNGKVKLIYAKEGQRWGHRVWCLWHKPRNLISLKHRFDPRNSHKDGRTDWTMLPPDLHTWAVSHVPAHTSCTHIHIIVI